MQIQKDEVRQRILDAATEEFFQNQYRNASLRTIAEVAEVATGNIYRYFGNKAELYQAVVEPAWEKIHQFFDCADVTYRNLEESWVSNLSRNLGSVFLHHQKQFHILIKNDAEAPVVNPRQYLLELITEGVTSSLTKDCPTEKLDPFLPKVLAVAVTEAVVYIFENYDGNEELLYQRLYKTIGFILHNLHDAMIREDTSC